MKHKADRSRPMRFACAQHILRVLAFSYRWQLRTLIISLLLAPQFACADSVCPALFTDFLALFEKNSEFQLLNTRFPLSYTFVDGNAEPEPKPVKIMVSRDNVSKYPGIRYPSPAIQETIPLQRKLRLASGGVRIVQFDKPDSDAYSVIFFFEKTSSCWQLVDVKDGSL